MSVRKKTATPQITITIDNRLITVSESDMEGDQALINKLLEKQPDLSSIITQATKVKITTSVSSKTARRRR